MGDGVELEFWNIDMGVTYIFLGRILKVVLEIYTKKYENY